MADNALPAYYPPYTSYNIQIPDTIAVNIEQYTFFCLYLYSMRAGIGQF